MSLTIDPVPPLIVQSAVQQACPSGTSGALTVEAEFASAPPSTTVDLTQAAQALVSGAALDAATPQHVAPGSLLNTRA